MSEPLSNFPVTHTGIKMIAHTELQTPVAGRTAVRYLRFLRPVVLDRLELPLHVYGRANPPVPIHPAHLRISVLDPGSQRWRQVAEAELPARDTIRGDMLSQGMSDKELNAHFERVLSNEPPYIVPLGGLHTDHLRVECDREHPVWPNHGECNGPPYNVPYGLLNPLRAIGTAVSDTPIRDRVYQPGLRQGAIAPAAPTGMTVTHMPHLLTYRSEQLHVGFSLVRPTLLHLGFDVEGQGHADTNRLLTYRHYNQREVFGGLTGPLLRTLDADNPYWLWSGEVAVEGDRVSYRNLRCGQGVTLEVAFTMRRDGMTVELSVEAETDLPALEWEAWRFLWNMKAAITSTASLPTLREGRNGDVQLPAYFVGSGVGCLACRLLEGHANLQTESYRYHVWGPCRADGFSLNPFPAADAPIVIPQGRRYAVVDLAVENMLPMTQTASVTVPEAIARTWSSVFTAFRPETGGFSNNATSINCHCNQMICPDLVVFTRPAANRPDPVALARFTVEQALLGGSGYTYHRNLYLDADPVLLSGAGRLYQMTGDVAWLHRVRPGLQATAKRILGNIDAESGLVICRNLTGNSGSYRWGSNAMDCTGFGHMDAYVNAWSYRALRNAEALFAALDDAMTAARCQAAAAGIRKAYAGWLVNPETGWVGGWRSRDGELHDYAFLYTNGPACAFGLLEEKQAHHALKNLEQLRRDIGPPSAYFGLPLNLLPYRKEDHIYSLNYVPMDVSFEDFTNGNVFAGPHAAYYIRALSRYGFAREAAAIVDELEEGYGHRIFNGRYGEGTEFYTWEGCTTGYEGTFGPAFGGLYAIAIARGLFAPTDPEWWPPIPYE
jgi:hypothetical protein